MMTTGIRLDAERDEIVIGGTAFTGGTITGGGLSIDGHAIRPVTLAERDELVALALLAAGQGTANELAHLVGRAAAPDLAHDLPAVTRVALEAVALHLAGASMTGPLARTALLVGRSIGAGAGTMPAIEADRVASALAHGLVGGRSEGAVSDDAGWTTISYSAASTTAPAAHSIVAVRDSLAEALLGRADEPLDPDLVERLFGVAHPAATEVAAASPVTPVLHDAAPDAAEVSPSAALPGETGFDRVTDRWHAAASASPHAVAGSRGNDDAVSPSVRGERSEAAHRASPEEPARALPDVAWQTVGAAAARAHESSPAQAQDSATNAGRWAPAASSPAIDPSRPSVATSPATPRATPAAAAHVASIAPNAHSSPVDRSVAEAAVAPLRFRPRPSGGTAIPPAVAVSDPSAPEWSARLAADVVDLDAAALALHRAADLRGLPR